MFIRGRADSTADARKLTPMRICQIQHDITIINLSMVGHAEMYVKGHPQFRASSHRHHALKVGASALVFVFSTNLDKSAFAESFAETILHGHIYYVEDHAIKPYPWPKELTKVHLRPFMRSLETKADRFDVRRPSVKLDRVDGLGELGEIAIYTWSVAEPALNHTLILRFSYAGLYTGEVQQEIWRHLGPQNVHLNVRKVFDDTRDAYKSILDTIQRSDPTPQQVDRALSTLFDLNRRDPKPYYFTDAVLLFEKIVRHEFTLNTRNLRNAMYLDYQQGFDAISDLDKGRVFYDLAYIFHRVKKPGKYVGPDFTYGDIALLPKSRRGETEFARAATCPTYC